jgi:preprotein translocase subunit SecD
VRRGLIWSLVFMIGVAVASLTATIALGHTPLLGLDLKGGVSVVLQPQGTANNAQLQEAVSIIDRRVNGLGVGDSSIARQGHDVVISLPGIKDPRAVLKTLGETAVLYFRPVICTLPPYAGATTPTSTTVPSSTSTTKPATTSTSKAAIGSPADMNLASASFAAVGSSSKPTTATTKATTATTKPTTATTAPTSATTIVSNGQSTNNNSPVPVTAPLSTSTCSASNAAQIPSTTPANDTKDAAYVLLPYYDNSVRYLLGHEDIQGNVVSNTSVIAPQAGGGFQVQVTFTSGGANQFDNVAAQRYPYYANNKANPPFQSMEAIELDGVVQSAPVIQASSFHGIAVISGSTAAPFTSSQASNLALVLKYGSLPVRFVPQSVQTVSATIGKDSLKAGLAAGIGGIVVVMLYMLLYYRALGLVVLAGLGVGGSILYSILATLSATSKLALTLAGVTGIIVSVGITVDSYVVYFERLKDEIRAGRTVRQSVERSFARAFRTVLTADLVSFMAALILYLFTIGDVRGFAFTLGLSTLLDVFTAYFFIRPAVILVGRRRSFTEARVFGIARGLGAHTATREA